MSKLPQGWAETTIGQCQARTLTIDPRKYAEERFALYSVPSYTDYSPEDVFGHQIGSSKQIVEPDDVLLCKIVPHIRRGWTIPIADGRRQIASGEWIVFRGHGLESEYLRYFVLSDGFHRQFMQTIAGVGGSLTRARPTEAARIQIPVPPLPEQRRIVAKVDSFAGKSKRARNYLDHIPRLVEKYKQAILAAAFKGELLGLVTQKGKHLHRRCWDLPESWRWVSFGDLVEISSNLQKPDEITDLPHIAPDNVESGTGRLLPYRSIGEDGVISPKHRFYAGQVIYSKIRPYLRKAVLVDFAGACSADMYPLTPSQDIDAKYLLYWLISEMFSGFTFEHEGRSVLPKINQKGLRQTPLPLPPISDQLEIVARITSAFSWVDRIAVNATSARTLLDRLDQAILAKAFRGELVPQDPNDEPASVLLERIRAERARAPKPRRGRRKTA